MERWSAWSPMWIEPQPIPVLPYIRMHACMPAYIHTYMNLFILRHSPSDDAAIMPYPVAANAYAVVYLNRIAPLLSNSTLATQALALAAQINVRAFLCPSSI